MTQPDKWDEIATAMTRCWYRDAAQEYAIDTNQIAANLRSAYAEGERAGMERAERELNKITRFQTCTCHNMLLAALRAAKETKNPPSSS